MRQPTKKPTVVPLQKPWIGVDLDGTLAEYEHWVSVAHIGPPIAKMVERVKDWVDRGKVVKILTARVCRPGPEGVAARAAIERWCAEHLGVILPITHEKDFAMVELWDDRCKQVVRNEGVALEELLREAMVLLDEVKGSTDHATACWELSERIEESLKQ